MVDRISQTKVGSPLDCSLVCDGAPENVGVACSYFAFKKSNGLCILYAREGEAALRLTAGTETYIATDACTPALADVPTTTAAPPPQPSCADGEVDEANPCEPKTCFEGAFVSAIVDCQRAMLGDASCNGVWEPPMPNECCETCKPNPTTTHAAPVVTTPTTAAGACPPNQISVEAVCIDATTCKGKKVVTPVELAGTECSCSIKNCQTCRATAAGTSCDVCKNGFYSHGGECVSSCPAELTSMGLGRVGRQCLAPFRCVKGFPFGFDGWPLIVDYKCKCPAPGGNSEQSESCHTCEFLAGGDGTTCTKCAKKTFLHNGNCRESCAGTDLAEYLPAAVGGECREEFVCKAGRSTSDGTACLCPSTATRGCSSCSIGASGAKCLVCDSSKVLHKGKCKKACPAKKPELDGTDTSEGRVCSP